LTKTLIITLLLSLTALFNLNTPPLGEWFQLFQVPGLETAASIRTAASACLNLDIQDFIYKICCLQKPQKGHQNTTTQNRHTNKKHGNKKM
jgi:hypothetical protein